VIAALVWYALITSACVAVAALAAEALLKQLGRPVRWAWVAGLALAVALPAFAPLRSPESAAPPADASSVNALNAIAGISFNVVPAAPSVPEIAGSALQVVWIAASALLALIAFGVHARFRRRRAQWSAATIGGEPVLVSDDDGPAVMGIVRPEIVVPRWLLARGDAEQRIVVAHEREHVRSGDPLLLIGASLAVVLMPWNPAVWWMAARLRLAVELDCDARVLRAGTTANVYGNLLIDVAALAAGHHLPAPALLNPTSHLKRRLIAMHPDRIRFPRVRATAALAIALIAGVAACEAALPTDADVASLDARKAAAAAKQLGRAGDTVVYVVDGHPVDRSVAEKITAEEIARTRIQRDLSSRDVAGMGTARVLADTIVIDTQRARREMELTARAAQGETAGDGQVVHAMADTVRIIPDNQRSARTNEELNAKLRQFTGLLIVDGVIVQNSALAKLPTMDISSVEVIKGDAAKQLYGDRAAAGVIKVTTKK
jgi:beta-lactamase regulating signal transducer with metallopeptidase domain